MLEYLKPWDGKTVVGLESDEPFQKPVIGMPQAERDCALWWQWEWLKAHPHQKFIDGCGNVQRPS